MLLFTAIVEVSDYETKVHMCRTLPHPGSHACLTLSLRNRPGLTAKQTTDKSPVCMRKMCSIFSPSETSNYCRRVSN